MARRRDLGPDEARDRMDPIGEDSGYLLGEDQRMEDVLAIEAELLLSEGLDPSWPPLEGSPKSTATPRRPPRT